MAKLANVHQHSESLGTLSAAFINIFNLFTKFRNWHIIWQLTVHHSFKIAKRPSGVTE